MLRQLPAILSGKVSDKFDLRKTFLTHFAYHIMRQVGDAFEAKSEGGTDDLGHSFEPLKPSTIRRKSTPKYKRKFPLSVAHRIMRASDRLMNSLSEGIIEGNTYFPPKNQVVQFRQGILKIFSNLKYAKFQANRRPFWPENIMPWISEALKLAIQAVAIQIKAVFQ